MRAGRPPHQREGMAAELRRRIVRGELAPGSRLPSRLTMARQFNTAIPTVQDAVQCLSRDGFVETHPRHLRGGTSAAPVYLRLSRSAEQPDSISRRDSPRR